MIVYVLRYLFNRELKLHFTVYLNKLSHFNPMLYTTLSLSLWFIPDDLIYLLKHKNLMCISRSAAKRLIEFKGFYFQQKKFQYLNRDKNP